MTDAEALIRRVWDAFAERFPSAPSAEITARPDALVLTVQLADGPATVLIRPRSDADCFARTTSFSFAIQTDGAVHVLSHDLEVVLGRFVEAVRAEDDGVPFAAVDKAVPPEHAPATPPAPDGVTEARRIDLAHKARQAELDRAIYHAWCTRRNVAYPHAFSLASPIDAVDIDAAWATTPPERLEVHVPFTRRPEDLRLGGRIDRFDAATLAAYAERLASEAGDAPHIAITGDAALLPPDGLARVLAALGHPPDDVAADAVSLTPEHATVLAAAGVTSVHLDAWDLDAFPAAAEALTAAGITVRADLLAGRPGQTEAALHEAAARVRHHAATVTVNALGEARDGDQDLVHLARDLVGAPPAPAKDPVANRRVIGVPGPSCVPNALLYLSDVRRGVDDALAAWLAGTPAWLGLRLDPDETRHAWLVARVRTGFALADYQARFGAPATDDPAVTALLDMAAWHLRGDTVFPTIPSRVRARIYAGFLYSPTVLAHLDAAYGADRDDTDYLALLEA